MSAVGARIREFVGWAEFNEAQRARTTVLGFALLSPTYSAFFQIPAYH
jgi:hypothetical protein